MKGLCDLCMPKAFCGLKLCAKNLRELCALCERKISPRLSSVFFLSQKNTEEQNTQGFTETLSQPITQNLTATFSYNVLWYLYAGGVLWVRNSAQKGSVKSVSSVREKTSQRFSCALSLTVGAFYFSQIYTEEQNAQTFTETLSQPISQNVTANLSWKASVTSVCRRRSVGSNCAPKTSVNSVRSVREKSSQSVRKNSPTCEEDVIKIGERICLVVIWVILYPHEKHLQNAAKWLFIYDGNIGKKVRYNLHALRGLWVRNEEMPFLHQEEPFLASRRACSRMLKGMFLSVERRRQDRRGAKNVYTFGAIEKRWQRGSDNRKDSRWRQEIGEGTGGKVGQEWGRQSGAGGGRRT